MIAAMNRSDPELTGFRFSSVMDVTQTEIYISTVGKKKLTNHKSSLSSIDPFLKPSQTSNFSIDTICLRPNPPGT